MSTAAFAGREATHNIPGPRRSGEANLARLRQRVKTRRARSLLSIGRWGLFTTTHSPAEDCIVTLPDTRRTSRVCSNNAKKREAPRSKALNSAGLLYFEGRSLCRSRQAL